MFSWLKWRYFSLIIACNQHLNNTWNINKMWCLNMCDLCVSALQVHRYFQLYFNSESTSACVKCVWVCVNACVHLFDGVCVKCVSEVESSQQPSEEASPLGSEEADEEVNHRGDEDDACCEVVQVVESFLIGHHVQVPASCDTHMYTHTDTHTRIFRTIQTYQTTHTHTHAQSWYMHTHIPKYTYNTLHHSNTPPMHPYKQRSGLCVTFWPDVWWQSWGLICIK